MNFNIDCFPISRRTLAQIDLRRVGADQATGCGRATRDTLVPRQRQGQRKQRVRFPATRIRERRVREMRRAVQRSRERGNAGEGGERRRRRRRRGRR